MKNLKTTKALASAVIAAAVLTACSSTPPEVSTSIEPTTAVTAVPQSGSAPSITEPEPPVEAAELELIDIAEPTEEELATIDKTKPYIDPATGVLITPELTNPAPPASDEPNLGWASPYPNMVYRGSNPEGFAWLTQQLHGLISQGLSVRPYPAYESDFTTAGWRAFQRDISDPTSDLVAVLKGTSYCEVIDTRGCVRIESLRASDRAGKIVVGFADGDLAFTVRSTGGGYQIDRIEVSR